MKFAELLMAGPMVSAQRAIESAVATYQTPWKVVHEGLQNALDAIYERGAEGQVSITVNIAEQSVSIKDDGIGFPHDDEGKRLLGFHGSGKPLDSPKLSGNLGFGIKAVICSTEFFRLISIRDGQRWGFEIHNGYDMQSAEFEEYDISSEAHAENGTEIYYKFPSEAVTEFLNDLYAATPGISRLGNYTDTVRYLSEPGNNSALLKTLIAWYFRTQSYAANIDRLIHGDDSDVPKVQILFKLVSDDTQAHMDNLAEDLRNVLQLDRGHIEVEFENKFWDIEEFFLNDEGNTKRGLPFTISRDVPLPIPNTQELKSEQILIFRFTEPAQYEQLIKYSTGRAATTSRDVTYYQNKVFSALNGIYLVLGRKRFLDHMLLPAMPDRQTAFARGIPTQDFIGLEPGTGEAGRSELTIQFGPNVTDALNLGKLQLNARNRVGWLRQFYTDMFKVHLRRISAQIAPRETTEEEDFPSPDDEDAAKDFVERRMIFEPGADDQSVIIEPVYENELIALFFELLGRKLLDGYQFYGLSGVARYDGKTEYKTLNRNYFRTAISQDSKLATVEFKVRLSRLVDDLESSIKRAGQIHLLIVWEADQDNFRNAEDYKVVHIDNYETLSGREYPLEKLYPGVESILAVRQEGRWIPLQVLELKSIVHKINSERNAQPDAQDS